MDERPRLTWVPARPKRLIWPRLAEAQGSLEHDLRWRGPPAGPGLSQMVLHMGAYFWLTASVCSKSESASSSSPALNFSSPSEKKDDATRRAS